MIETDDRKITGDLQTEALELFSRMQARNVAAQDILRRQSNCYHGPFDGKQAVYDLSSKHMVEALAAVKDNNQECIDFLLKHPEINSKLAEALGYMLDAGTGLVENIADKAEFYAANAGHSFNYAALSKDVLTDIIKPANAQLNKAMQAVVQSHVKSCVIV